MSDFGQERSGVKKVRVTRVLATSGAIVSFTIGAGFASGQETLQYYTSMGLWGIGGVVVAYLTVFFLYFCFMSTGAKLKVSHSKDVFQYYCGKRLGSVYEVMSLVMIFLVGASMVGAAGDIIHQFFGAPDTIARIVVCAVLALSVIMGVRKLVQVLAPMGPIIVIFLLATALYALLHAERSPLEVASFLEVCDPPVLTVSSFWWWAGILYGISNIYPMASYGTALGHNASSRKEAILAALVGCIALIVTASTVSLCQMATIDIVYDQAIPTLTIIQAYMPAVVAAAFSVIAVLGIYTSICPSMWAFSQAFGEDGSRRYVLVTIGSAVALFVISSLPYEFLVNLFYPLAGYTAILMIICMVVKHVRMAWEGRLDRVSR